MFPISTHDDEQPGPIRDYKKSAREEDLEDQVQKCEQKYKDKIEEYEQKVEQMRADYDTLEQKYNTKEAQRAAAADDANKERVYNEKLTKKLEAAGVKSHKMAELARKEIRKRVAAENLAKQFELALDRALEGAAEAAVATDAAD